MKSQLLDLLYRIRSSYWFLPLLMVTGAVFGAALVLSLDRRYGASVLPDWRWLVVTEPSAARSLLATIAGSMMTVAGVTFSLTLLAVSHASAQLGPGLIPQFMRDRGNQFSLGVFNATFLFCLLILLAVSGTSGGAVPAFVPRLGVAAALALAVLSVLVLVYFVHHVAEQLNVDRVLAQIVHDACVCHRSLFPENIGKRTARPLRYPTDFEEAALSVYLNTAGGYLRVIDGESLFELANAKDLLIKLEVEPGQHLTEGSRIARVYRYDADATDAELDAGEPLRAVLTLGPDRTQEQDPQFTLLQLCEIAGRALSPGINDPLTACRAMDALERALLSLFGRSEPDPARRSSNGRLRLVTPGQPFRRCAQSVNDLLLQFVSGDFRASLRLVRLCEALAACIDPQPVGDWYRQQARVLKNVLPDALPSDIQRDRFRARCTDQTLGL